MPTETTLHNGAFAEHYRADAQPNGDIHLTVSGDSDGDASVMVIPAALRPWLAAVLMPPGQPGTLSGRLDMLATLPWLATSDVLRGCAAQARRIERMIEIAPPRGAQRFTVIPGGLGGTGVRS